jgi:hypothetical protein
MTCLKFCAAILLAICTVSCAMYSTDDYISVDEHYSGVAPPMEPGHKVAEQDCRKSSASDGGNLRCR